MLDSLVRDAPQEVYACAQQWIPCDSRLYCAQEWGDTKATVQLQSGQHLCGLTDAAEHRQWVFVYVEVPDP
jgi:hypothetical protein